MKGGPSKRELRDLVRDIARHEWQGQRDGDHAWVCVFCGAEREEHRATGRPREEHRDGCIWVEARRLARLAEGSPS